MTITNPSAKSDAQAKFISLAGIVAGVATFAAALFMYFTFREPFRNLVAQEGQTRLGKLLEAFQWFALTFAGLGFLLVVTNACFLAYVIKAARKTAAGS